MDAMASKITSLTIVYSTVYAGADQGKTPKFRVIGLWAGNSPVPGNSPHKRASNAESGSIWWRHHEQMICHLMKAYDIINLCKYCFPGPIRRDTFEATIYTAREYHTLILRKYLRGANECNISHFIICTFWRAFFVCHKLEWRQVRHGNIGHKITLNQTLPWGPRKMSQMYELKLWMLLIGMKPDTEHILRSYKLVKMMRPEQIGHHISNDFIKFK